VRLVSGSLDEAVSAHLLKSASASGRYSLSGRRKQRNGVAEVRSARPSAAHMPVVCSSLSKATRSDVPPVLWMCRHSTAEHAAAGSTISNVELHTGAIVGAMCACAENRCADRKNSSYLYQNTLLFWQATPLQKGAFLNTAPLWGEVGRFSLG
jgi:hypothetical protein